MTASQAKSSTVLRSIFGSTSLALLALLPLGCGTGIAPGGSHTAPASRSYQGKVFGGQQPVVGSKVYLYAAGSATGGSRSMLKGAGYVLSGSDGTFSITNDYDCQAGDQVYMLALGGDAGGGSNTSIGLMAAVGPCSSLTPTTYITINEVTTVATAYALSSFITTPVAVGADPVGSNAVAAAFSNVKTLVDVSSGIAPASITGSGVVPQATLNSLANSIAGCINATVTTSTCANLFSYTGTATDSNTAQAAINIAHSPATHAADIFDLGSSKPPFEPALTTAPSSWAINVLFPADVLTYHNNVQRTGVQPAETTLTLANVNTSTFGKLFTFPVDGQLYAQPLFLGGLGMPDGNLHNVVYAATAHGTVYAFDSDGNNPDAGYLWKQSLFAAGEVTLSATYYNCTDTTPEASLMGTPVIDRSTGTLYVVTAEKVTASGLYTQKIHAISLIDGSEKFGGPTVITATYPGTGDGAASGVLTFDALRQLQRPALLLSGGNVWITWASHCDTKSYHGYVMAYNASDVTKRTALFNNTPNGSDGGIWMSGGGPSAGADGSVYVIGGNGTFDANVSGGLDYGDTALKLTPPSSTSTTALTVADYFTPSNQASLSSADQDVGLTEPMLFDDPGGTAPHLLLEADKNGKLYLVNTDSMGRYNGPSGADQIVQEFSSGGHLFNSYSYFNQTLYVGAGAVPLRSYTFTPGTASTAGKFVITPSSSSPTTPGGNYATGGSCTAVSANGTSQGIVWIEEHTGATGQAAAMRAYDASNLATELYNTNQSDDDVMPTPLKFACPVVANGRVFVPGANALAVYGLLSSEELKASSKKK